MEQRLARLIADYKMHVEKAVELLQRAGISRPKSNAEWASTPLSALPDLGGGFAYRKHGYGCEVTGPDWAVDFDFGDKGQIDGFDAWRLRNFAGNRLGYYGFVSVDDLERAFERAAQAGEIIYSGYILYYVAEKDAGTGVVLHLELQQSAVADEVSAITAVTRPILKGILYGLKREVAEQAGGYDRVKLFMLPRLRRPGDGDIGVCFEYAVHDALTREDPVIAERMSDALSRCKVPGEAIASILFGAEKSGALSLLDTARTLLTDDSVLLYGTSGRPLKLKQHLHAVSSAFRKPGSRVLLPQSVSGLWKADIFVGCRDTDKWVAATLKINRDQLESAPGLRLGIVPSQQGRSDAIVVDNSRNLVICPLPYDHSFMQVFYQSWEVVVQFLAADARLPHEKNLPRPASRQVARYLEDRRAFSAVEVIDALGPLAQPNLLRTQESSVMASDALGAQPKVTTALLAPIARIRM